MSTIQDRLRAWSADRLRGLRRGIEKESLRVDAQGALATTPHPEALGSALTHPHITTDFSEAQLEFITGVHAGVEPCLAELTQIQQFAMHSLGDEMLWVCSMPGLLPESDDAIPIGRYGRSNVGVAKSVYRIGLGHRYGRRMQTISGIHYNWSMPGLRSEDYFALIRNFRRHSFLLLFLFGASPAVSEAFVAGRDHGLVPIGKGTLGQPFATSLRMGRLGYQSDAQASLAVSYNCLDSYAASLHDALTRPYPAYEAVGVHDAQGGYRQLATTLLQIENEFYSTIRPKRVVRSGERPLHALRERGVEYVEVRCMDLDPFEPAGIGADTSHFLDAFLLHCLLADSPDDTPAEIAALARNQQRTAAQGRDPALLLERGGERVRLIDWAEELLAGMTPIAHALDAAAAGADCRAALELAQRRVRDPALTPSARVLAEMTSDFGGSHLAFGRARSQATRRDLLARPLAADVEARLRAAARASIDAQAQREAADVQQPFEDFRRGYLDPAHLVPERGVAAAPCRS